MKDFLNNEIKIGDEVVLRCHGDKRPTLDPEWVKENLNDKMRDLIGYKYEKI